MISIQKKYIHVLQKGKISDNWEQRLHLLQWREVGLQTYSGQFIGGIRIMKKNINLIKMINIEYNTYLENPLLADAQLRPAGLRGGLAGS